jgi:glycosyltransferase involved in cell wall biosynthesis
MKKVSVIINCHNGEKYLKKCISSVVNQKYQNFEIIFFDNFSSDKSKNIAIDFKDERLKYFFSKKKVPLYQARNEALQVATGEIIAFLDVDDWWNENYLLSREELFDNGNYDYFYSNVFMFYEKSKKFKKYKNYQLPSGKIYKSLAEDYFVIISGLMVKKKIFKEVGYFNDKLNIIGDFDFVMRIAKKFNAHALNEPSVYYRIHKNNFSKLNSEMFFKEFNYWFENQIKLENKDFYENKKYFEKKLLSFEIKNLLFNKNKDFYLLYKILKYPEFFNKIKYLIAFFTPKILIKYFRK